jgi:uncharacterized protein YqgC (DUF456 family)
MLEFIIFTVALIVGVLSDTLLVLEHTKQIDLSKTAFSAALIGSLFGMLAAGNMFSAVLKIILNS